MRVRKAVQSIVERLAGDQEALAVVVSVVEMLSRRARKARNRKGKRVPRGRAS